MAIKNKYKVGAVVVGLTTAFAFGRYSVPEKIKIETKVVEVEKKVVTVVRDKHKNTKIVDVVKPDGSKETTTTVIEDTVTDRKSKETGTTNAASSSETTKGDSKVTISALGGYDLNSSKLVYGLSLTKPILGPIALGVFGLSNKTLGFSLGLTF